MFQTTNQDMFCENMRFQELNLPLFIAIHPEENEHRYGNAIGFPRKLISG